MSIRHRFFLGTEILLAVILIIALPTGPWRQGVAFIWLWIIPMATWTPFLPGSQATRTLLAAAVALLFNGWGVLLLSYLPGSFSTLGLLLWGSIVAGLPLVIPAGFYNRRGTAGSFQGWELLPLLLLVMVTFYLRGAGFDYKEIQGDEGIILVRAANALIGDEDALLIHQKGPAEILLPMGMWAAGEAITENWARLPFLWASSLSVLLLAALGRRLFDPLSGWLAGFLMAPLGFSVAFGRIVQYQSLVLLWSLAALLAAAWIDDKAPFWQRLLPGLFLAGGVLAHYDAILLGPATAWLLVSGVSGRRSIRGALRCFFPSLAGGAVLAGSFYLPYVLHPSFMRTFNYLLNDRIGLDPAGALAGGRWPDVWRMLTFYNSTYYIVGLALFFLMGLAFFLFRFRIIKKLNSIAVVLILAVVPFMFYTLIVVDPRTHVYTFFPGVLLFVSAGLSTLWQRVPAFYIRSAALVVLAMWYSVSLLYIYWLFIDVKAERQRTWAENRPPGFLTTWGEPPRYGLFGFPYQAGWRAAEAGFDQIGAQTDGVPDLIYGSNEEPPVTDWYLPELRRSSCPGIDYFLLAERVQDPVPYDSVMIENLALRAELMVENHSRLRLYGPPADGQVDRIDADLAAVWRRPEAVGRSQPPVGQRLNLNLGDRARLLGYDIDLSAAFPGGRVRVVLYWEALRPFDRNFQTFVHLFAGENVAQHDSAPDCGFRPTTGWEPGEVILDMHTIDLPADLPPGIELGIRTGMYDLLTGDRLPADGQPDGLILLQKITLQAQERPDKE